MIRRLVILSQAFFAKEELVFSMKGGLLVNARVVYIGNRILLCSLESVVSLPFEIPLTVLVTNPRAAPGQSRCVLRGAVDVASNMSEPRELRE
jgi:hypothetical protein